MTKQRKPFVRLSVLGESERRVLAAALVKLLEKNKEDPPRSFQCLCNDPECGEVHTKVMRDIEALSKWP